ncbi:polysaccharide deacetylase family protein [Marinicrinis sediminis]|uniref:Polysaccharide deacetylase family protein n=1 Tax=Marinicrinis sediminis TaxID=1652465 RepID=A0ABW5RFE0_9BACL
MRTVKGCVMVVIALLIMIGWGQEWAWAAEGESDGQEDQSLDAHYRQLKQGERIMPQAFDYVTPEEPTVYLTFDDGPSKLTPLVLDILKEEQVPATFFVLGELAEYRPELLERMVEEGHAIGNHTYNHKYSELYTSYETFWEQMEQTEAVIARITGKPTMLVRAPGGTYLNFDAFYFYYLNQAGYRIHDWTIDSGDSRSSQVSAEEIIRTVKQGTLAHEVNVLMHDAAGKQATVEALPEIIQWFKSKGYEFAALTPQVKPVMFRLGSSRWERNVSMNQHEAWTHSSLDHLEEIRLVENSEEARRLASSQLPAKMPTVLADIMIDTDPVDKARATTSSDPAETPETKVFTATTDPTGKMRNTKPIETMANTNLTEISEAFEMTDSSGAGEAGAAVLRTPISIRQLTTWLGGIVRWEGETKQAVSIFRNGTIEWLPIEQKARVHMPSGTFTVSLPELELDEAGHTTIEGIGLVRLIQSSLMDSLS